MYDLIPKNIEAAIVLFIIITPIIFGTWLLWKN
jgi:hypothetical protein